MPKFKKNKTKKPQKKSKNTTGKTQTTQQQQTNKPKHTQTNKKTPHIWAWIGPCSSNFHQIKPDEQDFERLGFCIRILKRQVFYPLKK